MTLALKLPADEDGSEEGFFIYFDAVSVYNKSSRGQVTKNPTARGQYVTDNFVKENDTFGFTGIVSFGDIYNQQFAITDEKFKRADNMRTNEMREVRIQESTSKLLNFLPESIGQFLPASNSSVSMDMVKDDYRDYVEACLRKLMSGEYYNPNTQRTETRIRLIKLYEFLGLQITKIIPDLCLVQFNVSETVDSGSALICDLQFEQVKLVSLKTTALPSDVVSTLKPKAAAKAKKGNVDSTAKKVDTDQTSDSTTVEGKQVDSDRLIKAAATGGKD